MDYQLKSQSARNILEHLENSSASASALQASSKVSGSKNQAVSSCINGTNGCKVVLKAFKLRGWEEEAKCKDVFTGRSCASNQKMFPEGFDGQPSLFPDNVNTLAGKVNEFDLYSSKLLANPSDKNAKISGFYNKYGAKCNPDLSKSRNSDLHKNYGCGQILVRTKLAAECVAIGGNCSDPAFNLTKESIKRLRIFYAVYLFQKSDNRTRWQGEYRPFAIGSAEPAIAICDEDHFVQGILTLGGRSELACQHLNTPEFRTDIPVAKDGKTGERGDKGPIGPKGRDETRYVD